jgi:hypothetical protein
LPSPRTDSEEADSALSNAIIAYHQLLSRIQSQLYTSLGSSDAASSMTGFEQDIKTWLKSWPTAKDEIANTRYTELLSLQASCLIYRPSPAAPTLDRSRLDKLNQCTEKVMTIYRDTESSLPRSLHSLTWRYQTAITRLYALLKTRQSTSGTNLSKTQREQIKACRDLINPSSSSAVPQSKELKRLETVFSQLEARLLGDNSGEEVSDDIDGILAGLYAPWSAGLEDASRSNDHMGDGRKESTWEDHAGATRHRWDHFI